MLNLSTLAAKDFADLKILHPASGEPTEMVVKIAGPSSEEYAKAKRRLSEARSAVDTLSPEIARKLSLDLLLDCIMGWQGVSMDGKKELPYSRDNASMLMSDKRFYWLEDQIDRALVNVANFIGG